MSTEALFRDDAYLRSCVATVIAERVELDLDWDRRYALMRMHTCLHVLSSVVVAPVTGGNIAPDKGRLDFDIEMSRLDAGAIERVRVLRIRSEGRRNRRVEIGFA